MPSDRMAGFEPAYQGYKPSVLPLDDIRSQDINLTLYYNKKDLGTTNETLHRGLE